MVYQHFNIIITFVVIIISGSTCIIIIMTIRLSLVTIDVFRCYCMWLVRSAEQVREPGSFSAHATSLNSKALARNRQSHDYLRHWNRTEKE